MTQDRDSPYFVDINKFSAAERNGTIQVKHSRNKTNQ